LDGQAKLILEKSGISVDAWREKAYAADLDNTESMNSGKVGVCVWLSKLIHGSCIQAFTEEELSDIVDLEDDQDVAGQDELPAAPSAAPKQTIASRTEETIRRDYPTNVRLKLLPLNMQMRCPCWLHFLAFTWEHFRNAFVGPTPPLKRGHEWPPHPVAFNLIQYWCMDARWKEIKQHVKHITGVEWAAWVNPAAGRWCYQSNNYNQTIKRYPEAMQYALWKVKIDNYHEAFSILTCWSYVGDHVHHCR